MVLFQDLQTLLFAVRLFEEDGNVDCLDIESLQRICSRVLSSDPFQPLAVEVEHLLRHAREIRDLDG